MTKKRKKVLGKSETLKMQSQEINIIAKKQVNKLIAFYSDYDLFLMSYDVYASSSFNFETIFSFSPLPVVFNLISGKSYFAKMLFFYNIPLIKLYTRF